MGTECLFYQLDSHGGLYSTMHEFNTPGHLTGLKKVNFVAFYHHQKKKRKGIGNDGTRGVSTRRQHHQ